MRVREGACCAIFVLGLSLALAQDDSNEYGPDRLLEQLNQIRGFLKLPPMIADQQLMRAAAAHSQYMFKTGELTHYQSPGDEAFSGRTPRERSGKSEYQGSLIEMLAYASPAEALPMLFDAPYHRRAFTVPGSPSVGIGVRGRYVTVDVSYQPDPSIIVYPMQSQREVPLSWDGNETPNPLAVHGLSGGTGYVVSLEAQGMGPLKLIRAGLYDKRGVAVPTLINEPDNDKNLKSGVFIIPRQRLLMGETYTAVVEGSTQYGGQFYKKWGFKTVAPRKNAATPRRRQF